MVFATTQNNHLENLKKLEDSNLGEDERHKLRRDIAFGQIKLIAGYSNLINSTLSLTKTPLAKAISKIYPGKDLSPGLFKTTTVNTRVLGGIFGAISIIDGCMSIHTGLTKSGETKVAYLVAGGLQLISGLVVLGQLAGLIAATGILGLTIFAITVLVGLIAGLITYWFRDKSEEWDDMERWFNRCLFGRHEYLNGLPAYRANFESMALAINDYMLARSGLQATLQLNDEQAYYIDKMQKQVNILNNDVLKQSIERTTQELYISVKLPNYNKKISDFEMMLRVINGFSGKQTRIKITKNTNEEAKYPIMKIIDTTIYFIPRQSPLKAVTEEDDLNQNKVGKLESYSYKGDEDKDENEIEQQEQENKDDNKQGTFKIYYKVGEVYISAEYHLHVAYWPKGKVIYDKNNKPINQPPIVKHYKF